jgi:tRNA threonylcarbamoyladenosine biosynthesis protein TsaB
MILDTSTVYLYVGFIDDETVIFEQKLLGKNNHSEHFLNTIVAGLNKTNLQVKDFDKIIVGIGPGSYTGLRVSLTVAKIWAWTLNIPLYTVSSLDLLGSGHFNQDGYYAIASVAKSKHVYGKVVLVKNHIISTALEEVFLEQQAFLQAISGFPYSLIDENNYAVNQKLLSPSLVLDLHALAPNYMRREL